MSVTCLTLRPLTNEIELVDRWLRKEYIKKWLGSAEDWLTEIRNETGEFDYIHHFIVLLDDKPIGFCQYYACEKTIKGYPWEHEPVGTFGIDYFIGEETYLKKGFGNRLIKSLVNHILSHEQAGRIIADPVPENQVSIAVLEKNGFKLDDGTGLYFKDLSE
ncbi:GNAT family N-acetyltransferase [Enterococcus gallinarum]|uniref:GNAT family N-acetyltransferase n=1 Tax=Enterococcus gallinarum TaxID=1353 RepID=UPI002891C66C|nr:GNAT family N-acetyltransferase [Enterococcus gallinarum]MDT2687614.1 GNAT family N-acetyltransferase [Enterococcus gallinarum]